MVDYMLLSFLSFCSYTLTFSIVLLVLSKDQIYGLFLMSFIVCSFYTLLYFTRKYLLFNTLEKYFTAGFIATIAISFFYTIAAMSILIYYQNNNVQSVKLRNLMIQTLNIKYCIWLNLSYYLGTALLSWAFMVQYYKFFWLDFIVQIFKILKKKSQQFSKTLNSYLKTTQLTNQIKGTLCALCLQQFQQDGSEICRLSCSHHFHRQCIQLWILRTSSCPLCRKMVFTGYKNFSDQQLN